MKHELVDLICCPVCGGDLQLVSRATAKEQIWEGELQCVQCAAAYPVVNGMAHLYADDESWRPKAREAQGWVTYHRNLGIYEQGADAIDLQIPYYPQEPWIGISHSFDIALERLNLSGGETILDLGAGRGWAAKQFALRGCNVVALDINPDANVGLGRAQALIEHAGVYFERVIADGERLPFQPETFDVIFCAASLHHSSDMPTLLRSASRVLKPDGRLLAIEPSISILETEAEVLAGAAAAELALDINENRPNFIEYRNAFGNNCLNIVEAFPVQTYHMGAHELHEWAQDIGAIPPTPRIRQPRRTFSRLMTFLNNRVRAGRMGRHRLLTGMSTPPDERQRLIQATMVWASNELLLMATKSPCSPTSDDGHSMP